LRHAQKLGKKSVRSYGLLEGMKRCVDNASIVKVRSTRKKYKLLTSCGLHSLTKSASMSGYAKRPAAVPPSTPSNFNVFVQPNLSPSSAAQPDRFYHCLRISALHRPSTSQLQIIVFQCQLFRRGSLRAKTWHISLCCARLHLLQRLGERGY
jgi:hypothetical protein